MNEIGPALIGLVVAALITWLELVTSKHPRTVGLFVGSSWKLWAYPIVYGVIALGVIFGLDALGTTGTLKLEGTLAGTAGLRQSELGYR